MKEVIVVSNYDNFTVYDSETFPRCHQVTVPANATVQEIFQIYEEVNKLFDGLHNEFYEFEIEINNKQLIAKATKVGTHYSVTTKLMEADV